MNEDFEKCENCECELPYEEMKHDREGVPLCPECAEACLNIPIWEYIEGASYTNNIGERVIALDELKDILIGDKIIEETEE